MSAKPITLQDVSSVSELTEFKKHKTLIELLVKPIEDLTFRELTQLSDSQIYCSLSVSIHDELLERLDKRKIELKFAMKEVSNG